MSEMLSSILVLLFVFVAGTCFPFPPHNGNYHHSISENIIDTSGLHNRKALETNEVLGCDMEHFMRTLRLEDVQDILEALAARKGVNPFLLLRKLNRRMRNKEEMEEVLLNAIDDPSLDLNNIASETYSLSPDSVNSDVNNEDTKVFIIPVLPQSIRPDHRLRNEMDHNVSLLVGKLNNMLPGVFLKHNQLKPPLGATVRVNSGDPLSPLSRDIFVTVSPLMTLTEALRQAEIKYQNLFGLNYDRNLISFAHSPTIDCYIVNSIDDVTQNEESGWKVTITEKDGQVVYDSFCLPSSKEVLVKPGTVISLTYVPL